MSEQAKIKEAIQLFEAGKKWSKSGKIKINLNDEGYDVVLSALYAQQEREKSEPCKYCDRQLAEIGHTHTTRLEMNTFGGTQTLVAVCDPCPDYSQCAMKHIVSRSAFIINFCPMCGRKLNIATEPKGEAGK